MILRKKNVEFFFQLMIYYNIDKIITLDQPKTN